jgi:hypothetical protein
MKLFLRKSGGHISPSAPLKNHLTACLASGSSRRRAVKNRATPTTNEAAPMTPGTVVVLCSTVLEEDPAEAAGGLGVMKSIP